MKRLYLFVVLIAICQAQVIAQANEKSPLIYRLSIIKFDKSKKAITVNATITNESDQPILIDKYGLFVRTVYQRSGKRVGKRAYSQGEALTTIAENLEQPDLNRFELLDVKESLGRTITVKLQEKFFEPNRKYALSYYYGQFGEIKVGARMAWRGSVQSSEVMFSL